MCVVLLQKRGVETREAYLAAAVSALGAVVVWALAERAAAQSRHFAHKVGSVLPCIALT